MLKGLVFIIGAYLLGSVPFAILICKPFGIDPRKAGSGNPGATNVARLLGKKWGFLTLVGDLGKALGPVALAKYLLRTDPYYYWWLSGVGLAAFLGHLYPIYLRFRGGKGVASATGVLLLLCPLAVGISLPLFIFSVALSGYVSVGSLLASLSAPLWVYLFCPRVPYMILASFMAVLIWIKHRENIKRLLRGEEKSWRKR
ncbi:glycerol-3-phosphate 1-O-acyltransferase PlsY [Thermosulfurimonas dismutans]|uniref:Glycerol-3-phosphate acyltransferase n=1 Tax=Thermosulfurimonas dismutans TaxID=999894 RepID=A0A179D744_9BACT|nr:glycerol-3-phosphate 1-O-acyltransferase PlsY [Thermosulfurimonas dismutans]OAQ21611.1 Acyl-phosphate:glycerol-3-phosphate O-acyltransferase PlsY [Thermosulfurimonas dismutans]